MQDDAITPLGGEDVLTHRALEHRQGPMYARLHPLGSRLLQRAITDRTPRQNRQTRIEGLDSRQEARRGHTVAELRRGIPAICGGPVEVFGTGEKVGHHATVRLRALPQQVVGLPSENHTCTGKILDYRTF